MKQWGISNAIFSFVAVSKPMGLEKADVQIHSCPFEKSPRVLLDMNVYTFHGVRERDKMDIVFLVIFFKIISTAYGLR